MKRKQRLAPPPVLQLLRKKLKPFTYFIVAAFLNLTIGCSYYKVRTLPSKADNFSSAYKYTSEKPKKYVILHFEGGEVNLDKIVLDDVKKEITAIPNGIDNSHLLYPLKKGKTSARFDRSKSKKHYEIHFYTDKNIDVTPDVITIPFSDISKVEVYELNHGRIGLSATGITLASLALVVILILLIKSSCPYVYIKNGDSYVFTGELYPGAILPSLERTDYLLLPEFNPDNGEYVLKITNELLEVQYTDLAELIIIEHPENSEVLLDQKGAIQCISNPVTPQDVRSNNTPSDPKPALHKDDNSYLFDKKLSESKSNEMIFSFKNTNSTQKKLVLRAKNSLWFDYLYGKFNEQFGSYYNTFQKQQRKMAADKVLKWRDEQHIPLSVYVKSKGEWKLIEKINPTGPMAFRDLVVPMNNIETDSETIEIKLETGYMFWEVDYVALDQTSNPELNISELKPHSAIDENGKDVTNLLTSEDKKYLIQPKPDNVVVVRYNAPTPKKGMKQTVYLKNRGYYEYIRNYTGNPDFAKLKTFRNPGKLSDYSEEEFLRITTSKNLNEIVFNHE